MNSIILESSACKNCDGQPFERYERRILRTTTEDICCTCGTVMQTFPAITGLLLNISIISIPRAVSEILERLLKLGLFILDKGCQRAEPGRQWSDTDSMAKTPGCHRVGNQVFITLRGPGNCSAELRWHYSAKSLLPRYPWEEMRWSGGSYEYMRELKPDLANLGFARPPRIVRSCNALADFNFIGASCDNQYRLKKSLQFERYCELDGQILDTTYDLCLVIKAQLSWLQIGSTFPDESDPRIHNLPGHSSGYPLAIEEAVDLAIYLAINSKNRPKVQICSQPDRRVVAQVENPINGHEQSNRWSPREAIHRSELIRSTVGEYPTYQGPFRSDDGQYLLPEGVHYDLDIEVPEGQSFRSMNILPSISVVLSSSDKTIFEQAFGGDNVRPSRYSLSCGQIRYRCDLNETFSTQAGQTIVTRITDSRGTEEKSYCFVSKKQYEAAWDSWFNAIVEQYKLRVFAEIAAHKFAGPRWVNVPTFQPGQAIAVLIEGRWLEAIYTSKTAAQTHTVVVSSRMGRCQWEVTAVKSLTDALSEGLHVVGPYNAAAIVGSQAKFLGLLPEN